jgi:putative ABC transport system substrate-binding protein
VELSAIGTANATEIERGITAFARRPNGGLIVSVGNQALFNRGLLVRLAGQHRLPTVYPYKIWVKDGGLASYGTDTTDPYRRAAGYIDRILKGEKPADLPVQASTKYELVVNLKTARTLGLNMPASVLARADEVIE